MAEPKRLKTIFTYPWDLHDEGIDRALDVIEKDAGLNGVSLAAAYHIATYFLPHNPRRKIYYGEDGMVLFRPDEKRWSKVKIRPRVSQLVEGKDWLKRLTDRIKKRGLHLTAWTVFFYNHYLARTYPDCARRDALGNPYLAQLCPANPDVRHYALALVEDLASNYKPDAFYLESLSYLPFNYGFLNPKVFTPITPRAQFLLGLCFCDHCLKAAGKGLNGAKFKADVLDWLERDLARMPSAADRAPPTPDWLDTAFDSRLQHFLAARAEVASSLTEEVVKKIKSFGDIKIESERATLGGLARTGLLPQRVNKLSDRLGIGVPTAADQVKPRRKELSERQKVLANIQPAHMGSEKALARTVRAAREAGVDGFTFYNYGLIRAEQLDWIGSACEQAVE